jgi:hypothetical protein
VIESEFLKPVIEMLEDFGAPRLHSLEHVHQPGLHTY